MNHSHLVFNAIKPNDKVLDVGGAAQPFRRADALIDILPYEKRYIANSFLLDLPEHFSKKTWFVQDICDNTKPFPFKDKEFDFVVCGHTLEDIRDPFYVIREMQRVGKRGYIEIPSRYFEQLKDLEYKGMCGASHHRWIIDIKKNRQTKQNELVFVMKNHLIHFKKEYWLERPRFHNHFPYLNPNFEVLGIFWQDSFKAYEDVLETSINASSFLAETCFLAKQIGKRLWDQFEGVPVELRKFPSRRGIQSLWELEPLVVKRVLSYNLDRERTLEIMKYEKSFLRKNV